MDANKARILSLKAEHKGASELVAVYKCIEARAEFGHHDASYHDLTHHEVAKLQELGYHVIFVPDYWYINWRERDVC